MWVSVHRSDLNFQRIRSPEKSEEMAKRLASLRSSSSACMPTPMALIELVLEFANPRKIKRAHSLYQFEPTDIRVRDHNPASQTGDNKPIRNSLEGVSSGRRPVWCFTLAHWETATRKRCFLR